MKKNERVIIKEKNIFGTIPATLNKINKCMLS